MAVIPQFERNFFQGTQEYCCIGGGEPGGKAAGLFKAASILDHFSPERTFQDLKLRVPRFVVVTTDIFDKFLSLNNLKAFLSSEHSDQRIALAFQQASLPTDLLGDLRAVAQQVRQPLAVRSSSLLEDRIARPFAGVYATKMTPNNQPSADQRFRKLAEALKFVWASTYFCEAREYRRHCGLADEDEKMAVIIQEVAGEHYSSAYYPCISGVARSFNFYPCGSALPADGVVSLALGLGKTIVDGGLCWSFCPKYPLAPPPWGSIGEMLKNTQTRFWGVNVGEVEHYDPVREDEFLVSCDLAQAEYDNTLRYCASTYDVTADRIVSGTSRSGARVLNFGPVLDLGEPALNPFLSSLLPICEQKLGGEVEIEFAVSQNKSKPGSFEFCFLQVRPMLVSAEQVEVLAPPGDSPNTLLYCERALGNGTYSDIRDIVYVRPEVFDASLTRKVAQELEEINRHLSQQGRKYLLVGFGRWGSSDPWLGVPVLWSQISNAQVIVETQIPGMAPDMSQGSHFFHNLTSFRVAYFSVPQRSEYRLNWELLKSFQAAQESALVGHVALLRPLEIRVDGRSGRGVINVS